MTTKTKLPSPSTVIKWTEEEWELIAKELYTVMGPTLLSSDTLEEIKAKDVFVAQERALPENRHRKLISISQGFQAVREKLKVIFAKAAAAMRQNDLFESASPNAEDKSRRQPETVTSEVVLSQSSAAAESGAPATSNAAMESFPDEVAITSDVSVSDEIIEKHTAAQRNASNVADPAAMRPQPYLAHPDSQQKNETAAPQRPPREMRSTGRAPEPKPGQVTPPKNMATATSGDFNEMLRPFVAMVAQEFAQALVNAVTKSENREALSGIARGLLGSAGTVNPRNAKQGEASHHSSAQQNAAEHRTPSFVARAAAISGNDVLTQEDEEDGEHDVQPLFDPKLPPSANSSDKPTVGVVGASAHDFNELQLMYPQLQLIAVAVDDVPHAASLGQCQRVIGLREDVPAHTDEVLRHTFRNRYLRLTGGMGRVREQLGAWLDKPGSTEPRRPKFNKPRRNNGQPDGQKKRFNHHPRKQN